MIMDPPTPEYAWKSGGALDVPAGRSVHPPEAWRQTIKEQYEAVAQP